MQSSRITAVVTGLRTLLRASAGACVVTIGTFDGVHPGHRALLARAAQEARTRGTRLVAITFSPRPDVVLSDRPVPSDICLLDERVRRLRRAGADAVIVIPFTPELTRITAPEFVGYLTEDLGMVALCVGADFALGRGREGTVGALRTLGIEVIAVALVHTAGAPRKISSSSIRRLIAAGVPAEVAITGQPPVVGDVAAIDDRRDLRSMTGYRRARFVPSTA